jgi:hypothetical protein
VSLWADRQGSMSTRPAPSQGATWERARNLASEAMYMVELQRRRAKGSEREDAVFVTRWWVDLQFFVIALYRLRRAAYLAEKVPSVRGAIQAAGARFDKRLPTLKTMRDVTEHFDEYAIDTGHNKAVSRQELQVGTWDGTVWRWGQIGHLDVDDAFDAAGDLYKAIIGGGPTGDMTNEDGFIIEVSADDVE